jgi:hypothetical protein
MLDLTSYKKQIKAIDKESETIGACTTLGLLIHDCYKAAHPSSGAELVRKVLEAVPQEIKDTFGESTLPPVIVALNNVLSDLKYGKDAVAQFKLEQELPQ